MRNPQKKKRKKLCSAREREREGESVCVSLSSPLTSFALFTLTTKVLSASAMASSSSRRSSSSSNFLVRLHENHSLFFFFFQRIFPYGKVSFGLSFTFIFSDTLLLNGSQISFDTRWTHVGKPLHDVERCRDEEEIQERRRRREEEKKRRAAGAFPVQRTWKSSGASG